jgi:hypothetical protein
MLCERALCLYAMRSRVIMSLGDLRWCRGLWACADLGLLLSLGTWTRLGRRHTMRLVGSIVCEQNRGGLFWDCKVRT